MLGRADKGAFRAGFRVLQGFRFGEYILLFEQVSHSMDRVCRACASCEACSTLARDRESESEIENEERFRHCRQGGNLNHSRQHTQEETQARAVVRAAVEVVLVETKNNATGQSHPGNVVAASKCSYNVPGSGLAGSWVPVVLRVCTNSIASEAIPFRFFRVEPECLFLIPTREALKLSGRKPEIPFPV